MNSSNAKAPLRILHVVGGMDRGGAETWLMGVLRHIDRSRYRMDFLVHTERACAYDEEIRALGSRIHRCPHHRQPWRYARRFRRILAEHGPFDVVHSHVHHFSGFVLWIAARAGVPCRVAHSHSDTRSIRQVGALRQGYLKLGRMLIRRHATSGLAASRDAAAALFGTDWLTDGRGHVLYCGIDLRPFRCSTDLASARDELHIPSDAFVLGHVGKFVVAKNHAFLVQIAAAALELEPMTHLVLVGDGPLREEIQRSVKLAGIAHRTIFTGLRRDVPRILTTTIDVLILPSVQEGLPLVALESQAAGVPLLIADTVTSELEVVQGMVHRKSLSDAPISWARSALELRGKASMGKTLKALEHSPFSIEISSANLLALYTDVPRAVRTNPPTFVAR